MKTKLLSAEDVHFIVNTVGIDRFMDDMIDGLTRAIQMFDPRECHVRDRDGFHYSEPEMGLLEWMPVMYSGREVTIKVVGYHPANPSVHGLPTILSTISLYDTRSGHLMALADGTFLTAVRTGAASAVASQHLASPSARVLGLIGCGAQAITQLHALSRCFSFDEVLVHDRDPQATTAFTDYAATLGLDAAIAPASMEAILSRADIICTATSVGIGEGPVFTDMPAQPWVHINAAGSDFPGKVELPYALLTRSFVCPDQRAQCMREGECQQLPPDMIGPALWEVVQDPETYQSAQQQRSVFDSTGWALEDAVAMHLLLDHADALGRGLDVVLESIAPQPKNPYFFVTPASEALSPNGRTILKR